MSQHRLSRNMQFRLRGRELVIEMAHEIGTSMNSLLLALQKLGIHPVSGKSVDDRPRYIQKERY